MGNQKKCLIIAGGELISSDIIKQKIQKNDYSLVIACDSGYDNAKKIGIMPQVVVGDFDSIKSEVDKSCEIIKLSPEKDETDLKIAIDLAINRGLKEFYIICATGGRLDHFLCNLSILEYIDNRNLEGFIIDERNFIEINNKKRKIYKNISKYISIIPITDSIILTVNNVKYPVFEKEIRREYVISVSNESEKDEYLIDITDGKAYIIRAD